MGSMNMPSALMAGTSSKVHSPSGGSDRVASPASGEAPPEAPYGPDAWTGGAVHRLHSSEELKDFLRAFTDKLVVMCCKAKGCRPCKAFERKYTRIAEQYADVVFLEIYGDENIDTRKLMISLEVKATPTFMLFKEKAPLHTHSGISEAKLRSALNKYTGRTDTVTVLDDDDEED